MKKIVDFKKVTVGFIVRKDDKNSIVNELQNLDFGIYSMGCQIEELTKQEFAEIQSQVPEDILGA